MSWGLCDSKAEFASLVLISLSSYPYIKLSEAAFPIEIVQIVIIYTHRIALTEKRRNPSLQQHNTAIPLTRTSLLMTTSTPSPASHRTRP